MCLINAAVLATLCTPFAVSNIFPLLSISDGHQMIVLRFYVSQKYQDHPNERKRKISITHAVLLVVSWLSQCKVSNGADSAPSI